MDGRNNLQLDGRIDGWNQKDRSAWQFKFYHGGVWHGLKYLLNWQNYLLNGNQLATCVTRKDSELL